MQAGMVQWTCARMHIGRNQIKGQQRSIAAISIPISFLTARGGCRMPFSTHCCPCTLSWLGCLLLVFASQGHWPIAVPDTSGITTQQPLHCVKPLSSFPSPAFGSLGNSPSPHRRSEHRCHRPALAANPPGGPLCRPTPTCHRTLRSPPPGTAVARWGPGRCSIRVRGPGSWTASPMNPSA